MQCEYVAFEDLLSVTLSRSCFVVVVLDTLTYFLLFKYSFKPENVNASKNNTHVFAYYANVPFTVAEVLIE